MIRFKKIATFLSCLFVSFCAYAQKETNRQEQDENRVELIKNLASYVKKKGFENINRRKIFKRYVSAHYILNDTSQNQRTKKIFEHTLKEFAQIADTIKTEDWGFVPWNSYVFVKGRPRMVWEAEPAATHVFGAEVNQNLDTEKEVQEGRKELERTIVIFKRNQPDVPLYCVLFDESNKIASWVLIDQGGLHYWIYF